MKCILAAAVCASLLAAAETDEPKKSPEVEAAEKVARIEEMVKLYRPSVVSVRFRLKALPDGTAPSVSFDYSCPACGSAFRHVDDSIDRDMPCVVAGFVLAPNRVLVQDLALRPHWLERLEVVCGDTAIPAKPVLRYPAENALLLETERPLPGAVPLVFSGDATNNPSLFHLVEDFDGRVQAGLRKVNREFRFWPATGESICGAAPNTLVVDASNRVVSVQMCQRRPLADVVPKAPAAWASEPAAVRETAVKDLEARLRKSLLPVYLHVDEEKKSSRLGFESLLGGDSKTTGDIDVFGLVLAGGDVLIPLNLDSGKIAALDKMETTLPDGSKTALEFAGAFAEYGFFLLRFPDGRLPKGVEPIAISTTKPDLLFSARAYQVKPKNQNDEVKIELAPRRIGSFKRVRGGLVVPDCARDDTGELLFSETGEVLSLGGEARMAGERYRSRLAVPGRELARLVKERDFDPEFVVRKGKDRIRVAWIGVEAQAMTAELAREKKALGFLSSGTGGGSLVVKVYPGTPAARVGVKEGDVLLWVRRASAQRHERLSAREGGMSGMDLDRLFESVPVSMFDRLGYTPWTQVESGVNATLTKLGIGTKVVLAWVSNGEKKEAELVLERAPVHYRTAKRIRNRTLGLVAADLTFEVRAYLKLADDAPGVVISKMQEGSPAAVAGLRPFEVITEVDGQPVTSAVRFAELIKEKKNLSFMVRRLDKTRIVRMQLKETEQKP